ncbi:MAG: bifunctional UDP-N-acetylmuramoyl-tripeptide:D-alanyl-D-alanine ligase/alanine racemase [Aureispira sp.]
MSSIDFSHPFWENKIAVVDSRRVVFPNPTLFFALPGKRVHGRDFIANLYAQGVRHFVVDAPVKGLPLAQFRQVNDVLATLQAFAQYHRAQFAPHQPPVLAITGSNGKTIVKEWLSQLLEQDCPVVKSPKSYNSQIGVPLSVLNLASKHELAIFEAGISQVGEMQQLAAIIQPNWGIFTNIGAAHDSGFDSTKQKIQEKLRLFEQAELLIYNSDQAVVRMEIEAWQPQKLQLLSWGAHPTATVPIIQQQEGQQTRLDLTWQGQQHQLILQFTNAAAIENCLHLLVFLLHWGLPIRTIEKRLQQLQEIPMRLEFKRGKQQCYLVDDSYNNDVEGLKIALDFLVQKTPNNNYYHKTVLLSDLPELHSAEDYQFIAQLLQQHQIEHLIAVGTDLEQHQALFRALPQARFYPQTNDLLQALEQGTLSFQKEYILIKGARHFELEQVVDLLQKHLHGTTLEIDLQALSHNLQTYKVQLLPTTQLMVMVKASAYGSGSYEVAQLLEYQGVNYLGVAYVDEGVALRQHGIQLPIMVMNPAPHEFDLLCKHQLEPVIFSWDSWYAFLAFIDHQAALQPYPVHLELDTGMHRLGFVAEDIPKLCQQLNHCTALHIQGIFSHLAAADDPQYQTFTSTQIQLFEELSHRLLQVLPYQPIRHLLNSAGIAHYTHAQFDLVRLGIGLYGLNQRLPLRPVLRLKTTIAQIKTLQAGESIGYSRQGKITQPTRVGVLSIGYADGFLRGLGNGNIKVRVQGQMVPTLGNVCMDMCFVNLHQLPTAQVGDEVIIFETIADLERIAKALDTIPYEILTNISARVNRVFYEA